MSFIFTVRKCDDFGRLTASRMGCTLIGPTETTQAHVRQVRLCSLFSIVPCTFVLLKACSHEFFPPSSRLLGASIEVLFDADRWRRLERCRSGL